MAGELQLALLGNVTVCREGKRVTGFISRKVLALLCYLAVTGRPHSRPALAGLLWGELPEANARNNLRKALTNLRRLAGGHLDITRQAVAFKRDSAYWLDVAVFETKIAGVAVEMGIEPLREAVELYRGDFLEGFYVHQAPAFEEWILAQQARLRELALQAMHTLTVHYTRQGEAGLAAGIDYTTRLLALEPWREEAHRQLMLLLARNGQRSAALTQYETCRQILAEELDVQPAPETKTLYEQLREGVLNEPTLAAKGRDDFALPPLQKNVIETPSCYNLPPEETPFIGREVELSILTELITDPDVRLITIVGAGGMGKTRLALAAAECQLSHAHFANGIYFVSLAPLSNADQIVPAIAEALNFTFYEGETPQQQLLNYLSQKQMLLILDNFEHLLRADEAEKPGGVDLVAEILQRVPQVKIVTTSRERLHLYREQLYPIHGLLFPDPMTAYPPLAYDAGRLFLQSARRIRPSFEVEPDDLLHLSEICRLVEGMPLGLELAAAWVDLLSLAAIATEIRRSLDFLATDHHDMPDRHRSIRTVFETTWQRLNESEQIVFAQLSIFRGGFTREAAQAVVGASLQNLASLANKSLLHYHPGRERYEIHELLRQYAAAQLTSLVAAEQPAIVSAVRDRHSAYYCTFLHQLETDLNGPRQQKTKKTIEVDAENIRLAWKWSVKRGQVKRLEAALESLGWFLDEQGRIQQGELTFRQAAQELRARGSVDGVPVLARLLSWQASFARALGRVEEASLLLQQSLDILDSPTLANQDMRLVRATILHRMGQIALNLDFEKAKHLSEESLTLYEAVGSRRGKSEALINLGWAAWEAGRYREARQFIEQSLEIQRKLDLFPKMAESLAVLGWIALTQGQIDEAEELAREGLAIRRKTSRPTGLATALRNLGAVLIYRGKIAEAQTVLAEAMAIFDELGVRSDLVFSNVLLAAAVTQLGRYEEAQALSQQGLDLAQEVGDRAGAGHALLWLGQIALARGKYKRSNRLLQESVGLFREIGQKDQQGVALSVLSLTVYRLGRPAEAQHHLQEALQIALEVGAHNPLVFALPCIALLVADSSKLERGVELYTLASRYPFVANSRWFEDVAGWQIGAIAQTLPAEVVAAAWKQGQARDLWVTAAELMAEFKQA